MYTLYIKNMVCDRCRQAVHAAFEQQGIVPISVELGVVSIGHMPDASTLSALRQRLEAIGFALLEDSRDKTVERIKSVVIEMVRDGSQMPNRKMSAILAERLHSDYSALSKLFSSATGMTIEKYVIAQRVELAKELLSYGELTLGEIALRLGYSSVAYLSAQFKSVTGQTPSQYKGDARRARCPLDKI